MDSKSLLVALVAVVGLSLICITASGMTSERLAESFKKINAHFDKTVTSDEPEELLKEIEDWSEKKRSQCFKIGGQNLLQTLDMLIDLSKATTDRELCIAYVKTAALEKLGMGMKSYPRKNQPNYIPTKVDRLIESLAYRLVRLCHYDRSFNFKEYIYGVEAFTKLAHTLSSKPRGNFDRDEDVAAIRKFVAEAEPQNGVVAEAGKLFLRLVSTVGEDKCNEESYEIILKNDLAIRNKVHIAYSYPERNLQNFLRLEKHVFYYITKHEEVCRPIVSESIKSTVKTLDQDTYRKVLALVSTHYNQHHTYPEIIETIIKKEIDEDFTIPLMNDRAQEMLAKSEYFAQAWRIEEVNTLFHLRMHLMAYMRALTGKVDKIREPHEISKVLDEYLFVPCKKYLKVMKPIVEVNSYGMPVNYPQTAVDELAKDMTYNMVFAGYQACTYLDMRKSYITTEIYKYPLL